MHKRRKIKKELLSFYREYYKIVQNNGPISLNQKTYLISRITELESILKLDNKNR